MNQEENRLNTFTNWPPSAPVNPTRLAKGGFFYTGQGTEVQCFSCGGKISDWNYGDQVMWRHRGLDINCTFVANPMLSGNVPITLESATTSTLNQSSQRANESEQEENRGTEEDEMYKSDALRFLSFSNWTDSSASRESLVATGFYHLGGGKLRCAWCSGELGPFRNFGSVGTPNEVHRMFFPQCEHAMEVDGILNNSNNSRTPDSILIRCARNQYKAAAAKSGAEQNARVVAADGEWRSLGVVGGCARHPEQAGLAARLATFDGWPADRAQDPRALADAGFFYTGVDDQVRCFYCDGGLGKWEAGDAPWSEHAHWFPLCGYVLLVKGQEFVDACRQRDPSADRGIRTQIRNLGLGTYEVRQQDIDRALNTPLVIGALSAGLDVARIRNAIRRRLQSTGQPFTSTEALIDAVLDQQLGEEPWCATPVQYDSLAEALIQVAPTPALSPVEFLEESPRVSPIPNRALPPEERYRGDSGFGTSTPPRTLPPPPLEPDLKTLSLEEENRQLKEARICKVCMDGEVSVVFLPCGHLVSCAGCGAALAACPLCRAPVRALVRAYLA